MAVQLTFAPGESSFKFGLLTVLFSGRCLSHLLAPLEEAFGKPSVPLGTMAGCMSEGGQTIVRFFSHVDDVPVASWADSLVTVRPVMFQRSDEEERLLELPPQEQRRLSLLSQAELWRSEHMIRCLEVHAHLPAGGLSVLNGMAHAACRNCADFDWDAHPLVLPLLRGAGRAECGFEGALRQPGDAELPFELRLIVCGMDYFEDRQIILEDGTFAPLEPESEDEGGEDEEGDHDDNDSSDGDNHDDAEEIVANPGASESSSKKLK